MQVKEALKRYIHQKVKQKEVIHLTKIRQQLGKCTLTIGSGQGSGTSSRYAVYPWQRQLNDNGIYAAKCIKNKFLEEKDADN